MVHSSGKVGLAGIQIAAYCWLRSIHTKQKSKGAYKCQMYTKEERGKAKRSSSEQTVAQLLPVSHSPGQCDEQHHNITACHLVPSTCWCKPAFVFTWACLHVGKIKPLMSPPECRRDNSGLKTLITINLEWWTFCNKTSHKLTFSHLGSISITSRGSAWGSSDCQSGPVQRARHRDMAVQNHSSTLDLCLFPAAYHHCDSVTPVYTVAQTALFLCLCKDRKGKERLGGKYFYFCWFIGAVLNACQQQTQEFDLCLHKMLWLL